jgi:hypothetical protein
MEAAGFEARVALQRKADEEQLTILHFRRRQTLQQQDPQQEGQEEQQAPVQMSGSGVSAGSTAAGEAGDSTAGSEVR